MDGSLNEAPIRLSVVIDGRLDDARARQVAVLTDRLGLAGVWLRYPWWPLSAETLSGTEMSQTALTAWPAMFASGAQMPRGLIVHADTADPDEADGGWLGRLDSAAGAANDRPPASLRIALTGSAAAITRWQGLIGRRPGLAAAQLALPAGAAATSATAVFVPCSPSRKLAEEVSAAVAAARGRPVLAEVTVSVGRTTAEARARADADELFTLAGHPAQQGLFGTLEECQATAARLAHAGAAELACYLPLANDLPDVLAQVRCRAWGGGVLRPGAPQSVAPPPPAGWGGRRASAGNDGAGNMQNDAAFVQDSNIPPSAHSN